MPDIKMNMAKSTQMSEHGYDPKTKTLAVRFKSGGLYHYHNVPPEVYDEMQKAPSLGRFLHGTIKGRFAHSKPK